MPSLHRRRVLHGAVALFGALAGCSDPARERGSFSGSSRPENVLYDPERVWVRSSDRTRPPVWLPREEARAGDSESSSPPEDARQRAFVASRADADLLGVADVDGADAVRRFVAETDFERQTLYIENNEVGACRAPELCSVSWSATDIRTDYARNFRDADVACRADERDVAAVVIRIPDAIDPQQVSSYGSGSGGGCRSVPLRETEDGTADARTTIETSETNTETSQKTSNTSQTTTEASLLGVKR